MKRSTRLAAEVMGLMIALATALIAEGPAKKAESVKPPWQRLLQGEDAKKAAELEKKLAQLQEADQFTEALKVAEALAELRSKVQGIDHWQAGDARRRIETIRRVLSQPVQTQQEYAGSFKLARQADARISQGRYREEQALQEKILALRRKVLGEEHPDTAISYNDLALNAKRLGRYRDAEQGYLRALAIFRRVLGEEHSLTAACYNNLSANLAAQGKYPQAEENCRKALAIRRKVLDEEHADTALSYNNLAVDLHYQGKYEEAGDNLHKALAIRRKLLGEDHPVTVSTYGNLAANLDSQGKVQQAEEIHRKVLAMRRRLLGEEHPDTALTYDNLAFSLKGQGKYREAEECYRKALTILRLKLGEKHPETVTSYNNLATTWYNQGKYPEAEDGFRKVLAIRRKVLGEDHPSTATSYSNLANCLGDQGKYQQAEEYHRKALTLDRTLRGEEHPDTAISYNNLALDLKQQGKFGQAEESYHKALAILRKGLGEEHGLTATCYSNRAANLDAQGKHAEAEEGYRKALAIRRKVLGEEHLDTARSYKHRAANLHAQGRYAEAEKLWGNAADSFAKARLQSAVSGLGRATITSEVSPLPSLAAVLARNGKPTEAWQRYEESLARGTWDDVSAHLRRPAAEKTKQAQLVSRIDRLGKLLETTTSAKEPTPEQTKRREDLLTQLRQAQDDLAAFTHRLEQTYGPIAGQVFSRDQIQVSLPVDAALIGWLDLPGQPKDADPNGEHWAVLLRSPGHPIWVRLHGSGDKNAWTDADTRLPADLRAALQSSGGEWQPLAERLRKQRLEPLAKHLEGVRRLIVLPSTALAGVPVEVIADKYTVSYAHSGTMYAHLLRQATAAGNGLFVLADPVFETPNEKEAPQPLPPGGILVTLVAPGSNAAKAGLKPNDVLLRYGDTELGKPADFKPQPESADPDQGVPVIVWRDGRKLARPLFVPPGKLGVVFAQEPAPQALAEQRRLDRLLTSRAGDDGKWNRLQGTRIEAASLQRLFGRESAQALLDSGASEQRLNELAKSGKLGNYRYLHLATHGEVDNVRPLRSAVILSRDQLPDDQQRTQLLVAGQPIPDGRLTAEEVLQRWSLHCDLVTLSACQTALGKYERGEGFVGFAQALILAGSRSVCLSLWKVDDTATALLMERFYQNLLGKRQGLAKPMTKAAALAEAKTWLRNLPREEAVKRAASLSNGVDRGKRPALPSLEVAPVAVPSATAKDDRPFAHPYYWAAFVLVGHAD